MPFIKLQLSPHFYKQTVSSWLPLARGWLEVPVGPVPVLCLFTKVLLLLTSHFCCRAWITRGGVGSSICWMSSTTGPAQGRCLSNQTHQLPQLLSESPPKPGVHLRDAFVPATSPLPAVPFATGQGLNLSCHCPHPLHRVVHCVVQQTRCQSVGASGVQCSHWALPSSPV